MRFNGCMKYWSVIVKGKSALKWFFSEVYTIYLSARAGGILRILQSDWFRERAEFSISDHGHGNRAKTTE